MLHKLAIMLHSLADIFCIIVELTLMFKQLTQVSNASFSVLLLFFFIFECLAFPVVVQRAKRSSLSSRPKRNSQETNIDDLHYSNFNNPKYQEHSASRETNLDDIIAEHNLSGSTSIDDLLANNRLSRVSFSDILDERDVTGSSYTSGL